MSIASVLHVLRANWLTVLAGALVGLLAAGVITWTTPRTYSASASLYVAGIESDRGGQAFVGALMVPQRVASYRQLMTSGRVLDPVSAQLGIPVNAGMVTATSPNDASLFNVGVTAADPAAAAVVANAVAERFAVVVDQIERPGGPGTPATVTATVVDRAQQPSAPISPKVSTNLLAGVVVGLLVALATVLLRAVADTSIRTPGALRASVGGAALGVLPRFRGAPDAAFAEAAREVRTRLRLATDDDPARVLVLCAAESGEGTTTAVRALAAAFARSSRVLVVDADLRRHADEPTPGLADVLAGTATADAVVRAGDDGVDVLGPGTRSEDPGDLLSAPGTAAVVDRLRAGYGLILIDAPAVAERADTAALARHADGVVLVCRQGRTPRARLLAAAASMEGIGARVIGSVLTMATDVVAIDGGRGDGPSTASHDAPSSPDRGRTSVGVGTAGGGV